MKVDEGHGRGRKKEDLIGSWKAEAWESAKWDWEDT